MRINSCFGQNSADSASLYRAAALVVVLDCGLVQKTATSASSGVGNYLAVSRICCTLPENGEPSHGCSAARSGATDQESCPKHQCSQIRKTRRPCAMKCSPWFLSLVFIFREVAIPALLVVASALERVSNKPNVLRNLTPMARQLNLAYFYGRQRFVVVENRQTSLDASSGVWLGTEINAIDRLMSLPVSSALFKSMQTL